MKGRLLIAASQCKRPGRPPSDEASQRPLARPWQRTPAMPGRPAGAGRGRKLPDPTSRSSGRPEDDGAGHPGGAAAGARIARRASPGATARSARS